MAGNLQVKFGARTGSAPVVLGLVKLVLGLLLGSSLAELFRAFPEPLLGSLLIFSGPCLTPTSTLPHPSAAHDTRLQSGTAQAFCSCCYFLPLTSAYLRASSRAPYL